MKLGEGSVSRRVGPGSRGGQERGPRLGSLVSQAVGPTIDYLKSTGLVDICQPVSAGQFPRLERKIVARKGNGSERARQGPGWDRVLVRTEGKGEGVICGAEREVRSRGRGGRAGEGG